MRPQINTTDESTDEKVWHLTQKLARLHLVHLDHNARARQHAAGEGSAAMLLFRIAPERICWHLHVLRSGKHPACKLERLRDSLQADTRISIAGYELVRVPIQPPKTRTKEKSSRARARWRSAHARPGTANAGPDA